uniref:Uncharacterized protein n=1 Tax=Medicago truncatula TaxID=3880 RepID=A2Q6D0_MEDTR|nr:hypothetical protein MtrDRAFT_AC174468g9v1 [Medicago truncatula]
MLGTLDNAFSTKFCTPGDHKSMPGAHNTFFQWVF